MNMTVKLSETLYVIANIEGNVISSERLCIFMQTKVIARKAVGKLAEGMGIPPKYQRRNVEIEKVDQRRKAISIAG